MEQSHLLTKTRKVVSAQEASVNAQLLERAGYVNKLMSGVYSYLPLGLRVLSKIERIVRDSMNSLGAQEILMPALQPREPWDKTGRWEKVDVLYTLKAGDRDLCLGPTHEEIVTPLVAGYVNSYKDLPQAVYQIQTKFRNEARPKSGLLRGREFRMKDLYSFHATEKDLDVYYEQMIRAYLRIFERCGLGEITYLTYASGGIFSKYSHEFQTITPYGEDTIFVCEPCRIAINREIIADQPECPGCKATALTEKKSIEVGNIFKLMYRFSHPFELVFSDDQNIKREVPMGCYGLGTSRLMGAIVEALHDEKGIIWPAAIAPYDIHLISLSKKPEIIEQAHALYADLQKQGFEVFFDDRTDVMAGEKFADADLIGIPLRLVMSDKTVAANVVECKVRASQEVVMIPIQSPAEELCNRLLACTPK